MKKQYFKIQDVEFNNWTDGMGEQSISVMSTPRQNSVDLIIESNSFAWIKNRITEHKKSLILADKYVLDTLLIELDLASIPTYKFEAIEDNKDIQTVLSVCDFLNENKLIDIIIDVASHREFNYVKFKQIYSSWIDTNQEFLNKIN